MAQRGNTFGGERGESHGAEAVVMTDKREKVVDDEVNKHYGP